MRRRSSGGGRPAIPGLRRCGARGRGSQPRTRAASGLRPEALRPPARSWLTAARKRAAESAARRRSENAAAERREARRPASWAGDLRRSGDRPDREAGHRVRRFRTSACRRSAPPRFVGSGKRTRGSPRPTKRAAEHWLFNRSGATTRSERDDALARKATLMDIRCAIPRLVDIERRAGIREPSFRQVVVRVLNAAARLGSDMGRLSAVFIAFCMVLIAGSAGIVTYLSFGFTGMEASVIADRGADRAGDGQFGHRRASATAPTSAARSPICRAAPPTSAARSPSSTAASSRWRARSPPRMDRSARRDRAARRRDRRTRRTGEGTRRRGRGA